MQPASRKKNPADKILASLVQSIKTNAALDAGEFQDLRRHTRRRAKWPAVLHIRPQNRRAVVEDISTGGCKLYVNSHGIQVGSVVVIEIPDQKLVLDGIVKWVRFSEVGVDFQYGEESRLLG